MDRYKSFKTVDAYIASFPKSVQANLKKLRRAIKERAPGCEEKISYGMPGYKLNGMLVYFAAYAKHIGFYPGPAAIVAFKKELAPYKLSKGTVQFPMDKVIPLAIVKKIVKFRVKENLANAKKQEPN